MIEIIEQNYDEGELEDELEEYNELLSKLKIIVEEKEREQKE